MTGSVKILHLISHFGYGGTERQLYLTLKHLDATMFRSHVAIFNDSPNENYEEDVRKLGCVIHPLYESYSRVASTVPYLVRLCRHERFDVIHAWSFHLTIIAAFIGWIMRVPKRFGSLRNTLVHSRETMPRWIVNGALKARVHWVVNAESIRRELIREGIKEYQITFIPNIVDHYGENGSTRNHNQPVIASVGNLRQVKNHELFIEILARIARSNPDVRGVIVGEEVEHGMKRRLLALAEEMGVSAQLKFTGFIKDVRSFLHTVDVLCLTSKSEGMPNVVLEAMQSGTPVVAANVGAVPEIIEHGINGFIADNTEEFADHISQLLCEGTVRENIVNNAIDTIKSRHGSDAVIPMIRQLYSSDGQE